MQHPEITESEMTMHDGVTWIVTGPRGRFWSIVWQPARPVDNIRAWPFPGGRTQHRGQASDLAAAREIAAQIAARINADR